MARQSATSPQSSLPQAALNLPKYCCWSWPEETKMAALKVLAFSGSMRTDSLNKKLVRAAAAAVERAGAEVTHLELRDLALPLYDGDVEAQFGLPEGARRLKQLMLSHDAFLISSPEY